MKNFSHTPRQRYGRPDDTRKWISLVLIIITGLAFTTSFAQVGISDGTIAPHQSAMLQVEPGVDPTKPRGFVMPRFSSTQETNLLSNEIADGLVYYSYSKKKVMYYNGTSVSMLNPWTVNADGTRVFFPGASSRVGIGNSNPQSTLDVSGKITANELQLNGGGAVTGTVTVNGSVNVSGGAISGNGTIPLGGIIMWSGAINSIPAGWRLCDGTNGTPNLSGRFIVGYNANAAATPADATNLEVNYGNVGNTGGLNTVALTTDQLPAHNHTGQTNEDGNHWHEIPIDTGSGGSGTQGANGNSLYGAETVVNAIPNKMASTNSVTGHHRHNFATNNTGGGQVHENRPPYYVLAFIIRFQ